jgi:hypothetical protein
MRKFSPTTTFDQVNIEKYLDDRKFFTLGETDRARGFIKCLQQEIKLSGMRGVDESWAEFLRTPRLKQFQIHEIATQDDLYTLEGDFDPSLAFTATTVCHPFRGGKITSKLSVPADRIIAYCRRCNKDGLAEGERVWQVTLRDSDILRGLGRSVVVEGVVFV